MAPLCPDWILSNNSNVHSAVNRGWFKTFTPYKTYLTHGVLGGPPIEVSGIGTVEIEVLKHKINKGKRSRRTITLHNVLHTPTAICNVLGGPFLAESGGSVSFSDLVLRGEDGSIIASFEPHPKQESQEMSGLPRLRLYNRPDIAFAKSKLEPDTIYMISVTWPEAERKKYIAHCNATVTAAASPATAGPVPPYTAAEKYWLKHKSGHKDEFHFLRAHGLSIYKDEDREEGRQVLRFFMTLDDSDEENDDEEEEWDPTSHQADYAFKQDELDFIEKHWLTSEIFLITHRLKFYKSEDLEEGRAIVRALMVGTSSQG